MKLKDLWDLIKETFKKWSEDKAPRLAAALSYYTIFSLAPFLVIIIAVAGFFLGEDAVQGNLVAQIEGLVGTQGAEMIQTMIASAYEPTAGIIATVISIVLLIFGASGVFAQLQDALNVIWNVQAKPGRGILAVVKDRFFSFTMVLGVAFLLLVSLVLSAAIAGLTEFIAGLFPGSEIVIWVLNLVVSLGIITLVFAMMFKILPDAEVAWSDVWLGAFVTAILFTVGRELIGLYLGQAAVGSAYGAAGSLVIILLWIYYSSMILFWGAEFTQVYANRFGSQIVPSEGAVAITEEIRAQQGIPRQETLVAAGQSQELRSEQQQTWQARPFDPSWAQAEYKPGVLQPPRTRAEKSMAALAGLLVALVGFTSTAIVRSRKG